jgi:hypothetical protein
MRDIETNFKRLLKLACHLRNNNLSMKYEHVQVLSFYRGMYVIRYRKDYYKIFPFILNELDAIFEDWNFNFEGQLLCMEHSLSTSMYILLEYFGLEMKEFLHCMCIERGNVKKYGGKELTPTSTPVHVSENIYCLLESVLNRIERNEKVSTRKVLVEKYTKIRPSTWLTEQFRIGGY